jgi:ABC-2 type transport system permease protein
MVDSRYFNVKIGRDRREFTDDIIAGRLRGFVVIPAYFSAFRHRPSTVAPIQVIADGSETNTATFVVNYVTSAWGNWLVQEKISNKLKGLPLVNVVPRYWYNQELESRNFLVPGSLAIIMTLIGTLLTALVVAREWERGTMEALMATPVTIGEILTAKVIPYFILGMLAMMLCVIEAKIMYNLPFRGSWLCLGVVTACFLTTALGLGLLISTLARDQFVASQAAMVAAFLPAYMLSGFIFEIESMPTPIKWFTYVVPARYFVSSLQTIFLVGDVWTLIRINIIPMLLIGALFFYLTVRNTAKRLD